MISLLVEGLVDESITGPDPGMPAVPRLPKTNYGQNSSTGVHLSGQICSIITSHRASRHIYPGIPAEFFAKTPIAMQDLKPELYHIRVTIAQRLGKTRPATRRP
jgi:hypothetical protein